MSNERVEGLQSELDAGATPLLQQVHGRRGYALSYHRMFAAHDPALLAAYDAYYRELTLQPRALSPQTREIVWIALQAATREHHGVIHLRRAEACGLDRDAIADSLAVAAAVEAWPVLAFGDRHWTDWTPLSLGAPRYVPDVRGGVRRAAARRSGAGSHRLSRRAAHPCRPGAAPAACRGGWRHRADDRRGVVLPAAPGGWPSPDRRRTGLGARARRRSGGGALALWRRAQ